MRFRFVAAAALSLCVSLGALIVLSSCTPDSAEASSEAEPREAILLELFTSQGCSSCPSADRYLRELGARRDLEAEVQPLSFHVDYWNRLGWRDPFSSAAWSDRQRRYARLLENDRVYTPNLVIDGRFSCVGSDRECVEAAIHKARSQAPKRQQDKPLSLVVETSLKRPGVIQVAAMAKWQSASTARADLMVLLTESGLETDVSRGENARRRLAHDWVVRELELVGRIESEGAPTCVFREIALEPEWDPRELDVVVIAQGPASKRVFGTVRVAVPDEIEPSSGLEGVCSG